MHNKNTQVFSFILAMLLTILVTGCSNTKEKLTLADIDISNKNENSHPKKSFNKKLSDEEIKAAYYAYIKNASSTDKSRLAAINRLAAIELDLLTKSGPEDNTTADDIEDEEAFQQKLSHTANLLKTSTRQFSKIKGNDKSLYQLAQTYDQLGKHQESIQTLKTLVKEHPKSLYFAESYFRIAETAFITRDYITAEDAYTEAILNPSNDHYYEKSLFKRGWTRYKQAIYSEAVDDYLLALDYHQNTALSPSTNINTSTSPNEQFAEYFRALGLAFSHIGNTQQLKEYHAKNADFDYSYNIHKALADIYIQQERYSDAVDSLKNYKTNYPTSDLQAIAQLDILETWKKGGFLQPFHQELDILYRHYNADSPFWITKAEEKRKKDVIAEIKEYVISMSAFYHGRHQSNKKLKDYQQAKLWYERYLLSYRAYAKSDKIYPLYAQLLASQGDTKNALHFYELAAYDDGLILDEPSAYATIEISKSLYDTAKESQDEKQQRQWLDKTIAYSSLFIELYPNDLQTPDILLHAVEISFHHQQFSKAIELSKFTSPSTPRTVKRSINTIKSRSYFELGNYAAAESSYKDLLHDTVNPQKVKEITTAIALSIYKNSEHLYSLNKVDDAIVKFSRIAIETPDAALAENGLFQAVSLAMQHSKWDFAVHYGEQYKSLYPKTHNSKLISRQLSVAYLNTNQTKKAARQLSYIAKNDSDINVKRTALWQAAELHEKNNEIPKAIVAYRDFAHTYKSPYSQHAEAMYKLSALYKATGDYSKRYFWQIRIKNTDKQTPDGLKSNRTNHIASTTVLDLAIQQQLIFSKTRLVQPLKKKLKLKKKAMQESIRLFGRASSYGITDITTQATFAIADIYKEFSVSLLESERPTSLSGDELEQYDILLEDQAFPFEEKSIELHEANLSRVKDGTYNEWINLSYNSLLTLFPARFSRKGKVDVIFDE